MDEKDLYVETQQFLVQEHQGLVTKLTEIQKERSMEDPKVRLVVKDIMMLIEMLDGQIKDLSYRIRKENDRNY